MGLELQQPLREADPGGRQSLEHRLRLKLMYERWHYEHERIAGEAGFTSRFRVQHIILPGEVMALRETRDSAYNEGESMPYSEKRTYLLNVYSGEAGDFYASDMLTTFGVSENGRRIMVSQIVNPVLDLQDPEVWTRVTGHPLYGVMGLDAEAQLQKFEELVFPRAPETTTN